MVKIGILFLTLYPKIWTPWINFIFLNQQWHILCQQRMLEMKLLHCTTSALAQNECLCKANKVKWT